MTNFAKKLLAFTLAASGLTAINMQAQSRLTDLNFINVALTFQFQGGYKDNGTVRIYANPAIEKVATKDLLNQLARDEFAETNYPANYFPSGVRLAINSTNGAVVVVNGNNQLLVDVSDIMSFAAGTNDVVSGRVSDATGLARPNTTEFVYVSLNFDDTLIRGGGSLKFFVAGLDTIKTSDSIPGPAGNYHENTSDFVKSGAGEGQSGGTPFMVTGSIRGGRSINPNAGN